MMIGSARSWSFGIEGADSMTLGTTMRPPLALPLPIALVCSLISGFSGCTPDPSDDDGGGGEWIDEDGDGSPSSHDCDDGDPDTYPFADELCDGVDNDCDGHVPGVEHDSDGDGFRGCEGDCDDSRDYVYPGAAELCNGADEDCDGSPAADEADWDGDGFMICEGDCNDFDDEVNPDGYDDILVGAFYEDTAGQDAGAVYLVFGPVAPGVHSLATADVKFLGEDQSDGAGESVACAGDVDGDGQLDVLIGARSEDSGGFDAGAVYLIL